MPKLGARDSKQSEPMTKILVLTQRHHERVLAINAASLPAVTPLDAAELARLLSFANIALVAVRGDEVVGYAISMPRHAEYDGEEFLEFRKLIPHPFLYIDQLAVAPAHKGSGIARALYETLESAARELGQTLLCCEVNTLPPNPVSAVFHRALGFAPCGKLATRDGSRAADQDGRRGSLDRGTRCGAA
jgi:predicted GNAT superfamily acetyltransferase